MAYAAVARPVFPSKPEDLRNARRPGPAKRGRTPGQVDLGVAPYARSPTTFAGVSTPIYPMPTDFSPSVFKPRGKRGEPQTYPVEKLIASGGFGAFSASAAIGGQGTAAIVGALVTGLVPIAQQTDAYYECFAMRFRRRMTRRSTPTMRSSGPRSTIRPRTSAA